MDTDERSAEQLVFYVEDEPVNVLLMRMLFELRPQLRLEVATSGKQALAMARELQPALLLLDLRLPDCIGSQLLPLLRRQPGWEQLPAVAVTAESAFEAAGSSFLEVWRKPLDMRRVLARLDELLGLQAEPAVRIERPRSPMAAFAASQR